MKQSQPLLLVCMVLVVFAVGYLFGTTTSATGKHILPATGAVELQSKPQPAEPVDSAELGRWIMIGLCALLGMGAILTFGFADRPNIGR